MNYFVLITFADIKRSIVHCQLCSTGVNCRPWNNEQNKTNVYGLNQVEITKVAVSGYHFLHLTLMICNQTLEKH